MRGVGRTETRGVFETYAPQDEPLTRGPPLGAPWGGDGGRVPLTADGARFENRGSVSSLSPGRRARRFRMARGFASNAVSGGRGCGSPRPADWASALAPPSGRQMLQPRSSPLRAELLPAFYANPGAPDTVARPDRGVPPPLPLAKRGPRARPHLPDRGLEAAQTAALEGPVQEDAGRGGVQQLQVVVETQQQPQPAREGKGPWRSWGTQRRPLGPAAAGGQSSRRAPGAALSPSPGLSVRHHRPGGRVTHQPRFTEGRSEIGAGGGVQVTRPR